MSKKFSSKFFRVAVEGATTDGRKIERSWIQQMAKNFNPATYGARVWMEHIRGTLPDSPFRAYGDVTALKAEEVTVDGSKKLALFAQIEPTPDLIKMTKGRQKIYTSIEVNDKFADTGEAYLVGLAVTDSPASLGTDILSFAAQNPDKNPLNARKTSPGTLFTEATETVIEIEETDTEYSGLTERLKDLIKNFGSKKNNDDTRFADITQVLESIAENLQQRETTFNETKERIAGLEAELKKVTDEFSALKTKLSKEPANTQRDPANGNQQFEKTDC